MAEISVGRTPNRKHLGEQNTPSLHNRTTLTTLRKRIRSIEADDHPWTSETSRQTPLPQLSWGDHHEVWQTMIYKEEATCRISNCRLFADPSSFLPRMRAILIDWIMEVCEVYRLRRVTYYLAVDYVDRFLNLDPTVPKHQLQLIGITSLFIAAKFEEIYPLRLCEFSYVCDGACSPDQILDCELVLLNALNWDMNPMTPTGWLSLYMQIHFNSDKSKNRCQDSNKFYYAHYPPYQFVRASHLIDLFSLDPGFLSYNYSVIAAGAMFFLFGKATALRVSGLSWDDLQSCTEYMAAFYDITRVADDPRLQSVVLGEVDDQKQATFNSLKMRLGKLTCSDDHLLQVHAVNLNYFIKATLVRLYQMGFNVRETSAINKELSESGQQSAEAETTEPNHQHEDLNDDGVDDCELLPVTYEIDRAPLGNDSDLVNSYADDPSFEFFSSKSQYTFDEILVGINDSNKEV